MKTTRTTLTLLTVVTLLACFIYFIDTPLTETEHGKQLPATVVSENTSSITRITIRHGDLAFTCERDQDHVWRMIEPVTAGADLERIETILSRLAHMKCTDRITPEQMTTRSLSLEDFELKPGRASITYDAGGITNTLVLGADVPFSKDIYILSGEDPSIYSSDTDLAAILPTRLGEIRERRLLVSDPESVKQIEIQRPGGGFIQITRRGTGWHINTPMDARASTPHVQLLLREVLRIRAQDFIWDPVKKTDEEAPPSPWKFTDDEVGRISILIDQQEEPFTLLVGGMVPDDENLLYARMTDDESVFSLHNSVSRVFTLKASMFRSLSVFGMTAKEVDRITIQDDGHRLTLERGTNQLWQISEPALMQADPMMVQELLSNLESLRVKSHESAPVKDLLAYGLQPPAVEIELTDIQPPPEEGAAPVLHTENLRFGAPLPDGGGTFGHEKGSLYVFEIAQSELDRINPSTDPVIKAGRISQPLIYRQRRVLALDSSTIVGITLSRDFKDQSVLRNENGEWAALTPTGAKINEASLRAILTILPVMNAEIFREYDEDTLASYGIEASSPRITLDLSGEHGIQKSLSLGFLAGTDGRYAHIRGQDVVFVIKRDLAERLTRDLLSP